MHKLAGGYHLHSLVSRVTMWDYVVLLHGIQLQDQIYRDLWLFYGIDPLDLWKSRDTQSRKERNVGLCTLQDDLNVIWISLLQLLSNYQKEDELELKNKEVNDLIQEHDRVVGQEWRGGVGVARSQIEELRHRFVQRK
ncbi:hypothetical protein EDB19DRAFT_1833614 [Suillus lakei]|nr:hypothetical protein EDB19DRAFT_1833614 [Suillus lakei]